jgi:hypothetical protein
MSAVASATGRATLAGPVEGDGPNKSGYPVPPGWVLGVRLTNSPCKIIIVTKPYNKPRNVMNTRLRQRTRITDLKAMERQSKERRGLESHCRGGQGLPRAVAPSGRNVLITQERTKFI